ncbi:DUF3347 domain-containing protein [Ferruginibacter sp. SUN002]|uniref:DUF3347 domain-containing protein n=1 Tax=Ferruginibacter sp. SUN002 TaxID=2937789 RepID=UPI003D36FA4C
MKKILLILALGLVGFGVYWFKFRKTEKGPEVPKQQALKVRKHSDAFYQKIDTTLSAYFGMQYAFFDWDTAKAKASCKQMIALADSISLEELKKDTVGIFESASGFLSELKGNAQNMLTQTNIAEMRRDFKNMGENIYPFLKTIHYEGKTLYWQNCPMAFDDLGANWLSTTATIVNPYFGKKDAKYGSAMHDCGEVMDSIKAE